MSLKITFAAQIHCNTQTQNYTPSTMMCLHVNQKAHMACHLNLIVKVTTVKEFSRSQAVMHTAKVVLSRKSARDVTTK